jgi:hypothetical protein
MLLFYFLSFNLSHTYYLYVTDVLSEPEYFSEDYFCNRCLKIIDQWIHVIGIIQIYTDPSAIQKNMNIDKQIWCIKYTNINYIFLQVFPPKSHFFIYQYLWIYIKLVGSQKRRHNVSEQMTSLIWVAKIVQSSEKWFYDLRWLSLEANVQRVIEREIGHVHHGALYA